MTHLSAFITPSVSAGLLRTPQSGTALPARVSARSSALPSNLAFIRRSAPPNFRSSLATMAMRDTRGASDGSSSEGRANMENSNPFDDFIKSPPLSELAQKQSGDSQESTERGEASRDDHPAFFISNAFESAVKANPGDGDEVEASEDSAELEDMAEGAEHLSEKRESSQEGTEEAEQRSAAPRDPEISKRAKSIISSLNTFKKAMPKVAVNGMFDAAKDNIQKRCAPGSYIAELLCNILDIANDAETPEVQEEALYFLLRAASILDETAKTEDETNHTPISLYRSLALDGLDSLLSSPDKMDMFGILNVYKKLFETIAGDKKNDAYSALTKAKDELLMNMGKEETNSLATKVKLALYLIISLDTGQKIDTEEFVEIFNKLGVIFSKIAQTVGGQANNAFFNDGGTLEALMEACKTLQQHCPPMTASEARGQLAEHYEAQFGPKWEKKMFKKIDLSNPIRTGTIAGIYKAITVDDREVIVKIKKPIEDKLAMEKIQVGQLLHSVYEIVQEAVNSYERIGQPVPEILSKANLFQRSESSTKNFFERFEMELKLQNEAQAMLKTSCKTPQVVSYTPNAIIMEYVDNGVTPFEYIETSNLTQKVDYSRSPDPVSAVKGWLQTHYPFEVAELKTTKITPSGGALVHVQFAQSDKGDKGAMTFSVDKRGSRWKVTPQQKYIDFSTEARKTIAAQNIADVIKQLSDGLLNCDAHAGNFIIAPGDKLGENDVYNIDFGFTATIDSNESKLAWNFIKGIVFKSEADIAKSYLDMTDRGRALSKPEYDVEVKRFTKVLKDCQYTKMLTEDPDQAMGPVMEWLAEEDFNISAKFYAIIRSFAGVASNAATMQGGSDISPKQFMHLSSELLMKNFPRI